MKNWWVAFLAFLFSLFGYSQNDLDYTPSGSYKFTRSLPAEASTQLKNNSIQDSVSVPSGAKVSVMYQSQGKVYFKYWYYGEGTSSFNKYNANDMYFTMERDIFLENTVKLYRFYKGASTGAYTIPFRLRGIGGDFDFESSLSLQGNIVFGFSPRTYNYSLVDFSLGVGITGVKLNSINSEVARPITVAAFTTSIGLIYKPAEYANVGVFIGWDSLGGDDRNLQWDYNNDMWLGVGINVTFAKVETNKEPQDRDSQNWDL